MIVEAYRVAKEKAPGGQPTTESLIIISYEVAKEFEIIWKNLLKIEEYWDLNFLLKFIVFNIKIW